MKEKMQRSEQILLTRSSGCCELAVPVVFDGESKALDLLRWHSTLLKSYKWHVQPKV